MGIQKFRYVGGYNITKGEKETPVRNQIIVSYLWL